MATFDKALIALKEGKHVQPPNFRRWLYIHNGKVVHDSPTIFGGLPWIPQQNELLSDNWTIENEIST